MMKSLVLALVGAGLVATGAIACSGSAPAEDQDAGKDAAAQTDRHVQDDAPPFTGDAAPSDGGDGGGGGRDGGGGPCYPEPDEAVGGNSCQTAIDQGSLSSVQSSQIVIIANLWPEGDVDWHKVTFTDQATPANCGKFNARVEFVQNPDDHYRFEVDTDDCAGPTACDTGDQAAGLTKYSFGGVPGCPCAVDATPSATSDGVHVCHDYSMTLRIRVFRAPGAPAVCENYQLGVYNG